MKQKINRFNNRADIFEETSGESKVITQKMARSRKYDRLRIMEDSARFGSTYTKIGTIQRRLAWPLRKDDTQIREAFHIFATMENSVEIS